MKEHLLLLFDSCYSIVFGRRHFNKKISDETKMDAHKTFNSE